MTVKSKYNLAYLAAMPNKLKQSVAKQGLNILPISRQFGRDHRGNLGAIFALTMIPVLGITGAAVDYNNALNVRTTMQTALDAATLAGGRELQVSGDPDLAWASAENYFAAAVNNIKSSHFKNDAAKPKLTSTQGGSIDLDTNTISLSAAATFKPSILPLIGIDTLEVSVQTMGELKQGTAGNNGYENLELVMMLDTTGSMGGSKMTALKASAKDLVQIVLGNGVQDEFTSKIALAPFAASVNVGSGSTYINVVTGYTQIASLIPGLDILPAAPAGPEFAEMTPSFSTLASGFSAQIIHQAKHKKRRRRIRKRRSVNGGNRIAMTPIMETTMEAMAIPVFLNQ